MKSVAERTVSDGNDFLDLDNAPYLCLPHVDVIEWQSVNFDVLAEKSDSEIAQGNNEVV